MKKFEYQSVITEIKGFFGGKVDSVDMIEELNKLGQEGWELVNSLPSNGADSSTRYIVSVFKREI